MSSTIKTRIFSFAMQFSRRKGKNVFGDSAFTDRGKAPEQAKSIAPGTSSPAE
jgi:hypothetical protein